MSILESLHRLRAHARHEAEVALKESEVARDQQQDRLSDVRTGIRTAQAAVDPADALALVTYQSFRLREELKERREQARLNQRERDLSLHRERHGRCVRDELSMQAVMEEKAERLDEEERRGEARGMDEIAARAWRAAG